MTSGNTRRTFLSRSIAYAGLVATRDAVPVLAQGPHDVEAEPRPLPDMLDSMVKTLGPPRQAQVVSAEEAATYKDRVPPRLIRFWQEQGRGSYFDGMYWICDPAPLSRAVLYFAFDGDPEFNSADMTAVAYTAFGRLKIWDRHRANIDIEFALSQVHCPPESRHINSRTGERFPDDFMIGTTVGMVRNQFLPSELAFLEAAKIGLIQGD